VANVAGRGERHFQYCLSIGKQALSNKILAFTRSLADGSLLILQLNDPAENKLKDLLSVVTTQNGIIDLSRGRYAEALQFL
jgi:hypothetical protein